MITPIYDCKNEKRWTEDPVEGDDSNWLEVVTVRCGCCGDFFCGTREELMRLGWKCHRVWKRQLEQGAQLRTDDDYLEVEIFQGERFSCGECETHGLRPTVKADKFVGSVLVDLESLFSPEIQKIRRI